MGENSGIDRRSAIKAAVGAAAAGFVWSAPRVEGLSIRPNYAAAVSTGFAAVPWAGGASPSTTSPVSALSNLSCVNSANVVHGGDFFSLRIAGTGLSNCSATIDVGGPATGGSVTSTLVTLTGNAGSITGIVLSGTFTCT